MLLWKRGPWSGWVTSRADCDNTCFPFVALNFGLEPPKSTLHSVNTGLQLTGSRLVQEMIAVLLLIIYSAVLVSFQLGSVYKGCDQ